MDLARLAWSRLRPDRPAADAGDAELFRMIEAGSEAAFEALWHRYGAAIYTACLRIVREPEAAEDAAQEAFVRAWRAAGSVDPRRGEPVAWLMTVARNAARNVARVRVPEPVEDASAREPAADGEAVERIWLHGALTRLPAPERQALELAYFAGLSHAEVADRLGAPLGTVKSRIRRGLGRLAAMAEER